MTVETIYEYWGDDKLSIKVYVDGVLKYTATGDDDNDGVLIDEAQEWLDDEYPDNEVTL